MNFLGQGFQKLEHYGQIYATENITTLYSPVVIITAN